MTKVLLGMTQLQLEHISNETNENLRQINDKFSFRLKVREPISVIFPLSVTAFILLIISNDVINLISYLFKKTTKL